MMVKIFSAAIITVAIGFGLGSIPFLNEHLHWNIWYVVPISGLLFGCLVGGIQFLFFYLSNQQINKFLIAYIALAAIVGYVAVNYGIYTTSVVEIEEVEGIADGRYHLSDLMTFWEFTKYNLGFISEETEAGEIIFKMDSIWAMVSYAADMVGAMLGTVGVMLVCSEKYPFCSSCKKYKKREHKYGIQFDNEEKPVEAVINNLKELNEKEGYNQIVCYINDLAAECAGNKGDVMIIIDKRSCPICNEGTIIGKVNRRNKKDWVEIKELGFSFTSKPAAAHSVPENEEL